eukprot:TRINITY_DN8225_c0_g1_i1.p1 TRINITY_DN8225_c0_g1~~TRINITY_DN8225_c0_g1_i1.p1  ORF type:complete len:689 (+),score=233.06 TRINITY_DN8225_c0_g1_i1:181-2067(+)
MELLKSRIKQQGAQNRPEAEKSVHEVALEFAEDFKKRTAEKQREIEEKFKLDDIYAQIKALKDKNDELVSSNEQLKADNQSLNDKIAEEKKRADDANNLALGTDSANQQEISRLKREIESLGTDRDAKAKLLGETEHRAKEVEMKVDTLNQQLEAAVKERDELKVANEELGKTVGSLKVLEANKNADAIRELEGKLKEQKEKFEAELKAAQETIEESQKKADDSAQAVISMEKQLTGAKDKEEQATKLAADATKTAEEMSSKVDSLEAELETSKEFHEQAQSDIKKLQEEKSALEKQLEERKSQSSDQVKVLEEKLQNLTKEHDALKKDSEEKKSALEALQAKLASDLASRDQSVSALKSQLQESQSKLKEVESARASLQKQLAESESNTQSKLKEKQKELSDVESKLADVKKQLEKSTKEHSSHVESAQTQIQELQRQITSVASEKKMIETHYGEQVAALKQQLESSGGKKGVSPLFIQQLAILQQDLRQFKDLTEEIKKKQLQFKNAEEMLEKLDEARTKALRNIEESRASRAELEATVKSLENSLRTEKENSSQWREQFLTAEDERQNAVAALKQVPTTQIKTRAVPGASQNIWFYLFMMLLVAVVSVVGARYFKKNFQEIIYAW